MGVGERVVVSDRVAGWGFQRVLAASWSGLIERAYVARLAVVVRFSVGSVRRAGVGVAGEARCVWVLAAVLWVVWVVGGRERGRRSAWSWGVSREQSACAGSGRGGVLLGRARGCDGVGSGGERASRLRGRDRDADRLPADDAEFERLFAAAGVVDRAGG